MDELEHAQRELGIKSEELDKIQRLLNAKTADMITAEKKLMDRNEKIHKLFRQLSGQRDDYEGKLQDLQQVCDDYEAEMEDLRQTMDEFFGSQEDWIHRDQLKALTDTIQRLQADSQRLGRGTGGRMRSSAPGRGGREMDQMHHEGYDEFGAEHEDLYGDDYDEYGDDRYADEYGRRTGTGGRGGREQGQVAGYLHDDQLKHERRQIEGRDRDPGSTRTGGGGLPPKGSDEFYQYPKKGVGAGNEQGSGLSSRTGS